jgi:hypothetical protein
MKVLEWSGFWWDRGPNCMRREECAIWLVGMVVGGLQAMCSGAGVACLRC